MCMTFTGMRCQRIICCQQNKASEECAVLSIVKSSSSCYQYTQWKEEKHDPGPLPRILSLHIKTTFIVQGL